MKTEKQCQKMIFFLAVSRAPPSLLCIKQDSEDILFFSKNLHCSEFILQVSCSPGKDLHLAGIQASKKHSFKIQPLF